jgi:hypothetical protein
VTCEGRAETITEESIISSGEAEKLNVLGKAWGEMRGCDRESFKSFTFSSERVHMITW